ncbi:MAG: hypothetical protein U0903_09030 [Planctomycetales bacterium]
MEMSRRNWLATAAMAGLPAVMATGALHAADETADKPKAEAPVPGALSEEELGRLLKSIGLKPVKNKSRYDFEFADSPQKGEEEWTYSMSVVLSADQKTIWVLAWLDELPKSSRDVPRLALLRMLAENDKMGKGKFFSWIPANRRFALQQVIDNREMTTSKFRGILRELGGTVYATYGVWYVETWKEYDGSTIAESAPSGTSSENASETAQEARPTKQPAKKPGGVPAKNVSNTKTKSEDE